MTDDRKKNDSSIEETNVAQKDQNANPVEVTAYKSRNKKILSKTRKDFLSIMLFITVILILYYASIWYNNVNRFDYQKFIDRTVMTLEDETLTLREFGYYIYQVEKFAQDQAKLYEPGNPYKYFNTHFRAGLKSAFVSGIARNTAVNRAKGDLVYAHLAKVADFPLTSEEEALADKQADELLEEMTQSQIEALGITQDVLRKLKRREILAQKYALEYQKQVDLTGYSGYVSELLSGGGDYFEKEIMKDLSYEQNNTILKQIKFGKVTVNLEKNEKNS